ncbi:MAG: type 4a pilus biogenesis protein PilO [Candidatus Omnitrophica bacterium]|nr:type 4a pilus biogenesis protein PilO [Candidatus Omnitrophota bacterium]
MKKKLTQKEQIFIAGIIFIGIIVVFCFMFIFKPMLKMIMVYSNEEATVKAQLQNAAKFTADRERLTAEAKNISTKIDFYEKKLPKGTDIPQVLDELVKIGEKSKVTFITIEPQEVERIHVGQGGKKSYLKIPIELKLTSGYHEIALFINGVENFPQFMIVDDVKIMGNINKGKVHDCRLTVSAFSLEGK